MALKEYQVTENGRTATFLLDEVEAKRRGARLVAKARQVEPDESDEKMEELEAAEETAAKQRTAANKARTTANKAG